MPMTIRQIEQLRRKAEAAISEYQHALRNERDGMPDGAARTNMLAADRFCNTSRDALSSSGEFLLRAED
jgi:hypothetical protein